MRAAEPGVLGRLGAVNGPVGVGVIARVAMPAVCRSRTNNSICRGALALRHGLARRATTVPLALTEMDGAHRMGGPSNLLTVQVQVQIQTDTGGFLRPGDEGAQMAMLYQHSRERLGRS